MTGVQTCALPISELGAPLRALGLSLELAIWSELGGPLAPLESQLGGPLVPLGYELGASLGALGFSLELAIESDLGTLLSALGFSARQAQPHSGPTMRGECRVLLWVRFLRAALFGSVL